MENCIGYKKLLEAVERDKARDAAHNYDDKLRWITERAKHYAEKTGLEACNILNAWEEQRKYWYMNWYQDANQPKIGDDRVRIFDTVDELLAEIGEPQFRCPNCKGISTSPYECDAGKTKDGEICNWKSYGLFGTMGGGVYIFVKSKMRISEIFTPVAWEASNLLEIE